MDVDTGGAADSDDDYTPAGGGAAAAAAAPRRSRRATAANPLFTRCFSDICFVRGIPDCHPSLAVLSSGAVLSVVGLGGMSEDRSRMTACIF